MTWRACSSGWAEHGGPASGPAGPGRAAASPRQRLTSGQAERDSGWNASSPGTFATTW